jgi:hypothetical protein
LPEQTAGISEFNSTKFIKIGQEINSGQFFWKNVCLYEIYSKNFEWEQIYGA